MLSGTINSLRGVIARASARSSSPKLACDATHCIALHGHAVNGTAHDYRGGA
jgi:hypothetical protein